VNGEPVRDAAYWRECWGAAVAKYAACEGEKLALEQENTKREALLWEGVSREQALRARILELEALDRERLGFIKAAAEATVRAIQAEERIGELEARIAELEPMATGEYFKQGVSRMQLEVEKAKVALEQAEAELRGIDAVLARRPALDKPTRRENIEHAITTAARAEQAEAENARLRAALEAATQYVRDDRPYHTCGIVSDYDDGMGEEACAGCYCDKTLNHIDAALAPTPEGATP